MRILNAPRRTGSPRFTPRQLIRLAPSDDGGLDLCFGDLREVPLEALVLAAVVNPRFERKPTLSLVLLVRWQPRPFRVAAEDVDFEAFGTEEDTLEASLRVFVGHLGDRHSDLLISTETAAFLRGTPVQEVPEVELAGLATSWLAALNPRLAEQHALLPEAPDKPEPKAPPQPAPSIASIDSIASIASTDSITSTDPSPEEPSAAEPPPLPEPPITSGLGPQNPAAPPPLLPPYGPSLQYGVDRLNTVTRGLGDALPKVAASAGRRLGLLLTAVGMAIPALVYLSVIGVLGFIAYNYARRGIRLLEVSEQGERLWTISDLGFIIPVALCLLFLLTLLEPLLVRRASPAPPRSLERAQETVLFSFVERLARTVGAPLPKVIEVTTDADLGLQREPRRRGGRLVLTLGLPLVAGLTLEQFAGLLARECTTYVRRPGNALLRLIRRADDRFDQLLADCTDLQEKRREGVGQLVGNVGLTPLVDGALFLVFGLTRSLIALLTRVTGVLRGFAEQSLAQDAALYQEQLVGSEVARTTESWAATLRSAQRRVLLGFDASRPIAPPPDHLPAQVVLLALEEKAAHGGGPHAAEPPPQENKARFRSALPATVLFHDFLRPARQLTSDFYRSLERPLYELEPIARFLEHHDHLATEDAAAQRFFGGALLRRRAIPVSASLPKDERPWPRRVAALATAREQFNAGLPNYRHLLVQFDRAASYQEAAREAQGLMAAGLTLEPDAFGLKEWSLELAQTMENKARAHLQQARNLAKDHNMKAGRCLMSALTLLTTPDLPARLPAAADWAQQAPQLLAALAAVNRVFPHFLRLANATSLLTALEERSQDLSGDERLRLSEQISLETAKLEEPLATLRQALLQEKNLFHHHGFDLNLAIRGLPADPRTAGRDLLRRVHQHYRRCLSRLAWIAEQLERAADLPPLPEVEPIVESRPWRF